MKKQFLFTIFFFGFISLWQISKAQDTISVEIDDDTQILILSNDNSFKGLDEIDLNEIVQEALKEAKRELENEEEEEEEEEKEEEENEERKEVVFEFKQDGNKAVLQKLNSLRSSFKMEWVDHWKSGHKFIDMDAKERDEEEESDEHDRRHWHRANDRVMLGFEIGLNNYLENGSTPSAKTSKYSVDPLNSRYVSVGLYLRQYLSGAQRKVPVYLQTGLEFSWYNFMLQNNSYLVQNDSATYFSNYVADRGESLKKSKVVACYFTVPIMATIEFKNSEGKKTYNLGVGAYISYLVQSYTRTLTGGNDARTYNNFDLNSWRYGIQGQVGYRWFSVFAKYDMSYLFQSKDLPKLNAFSFGLRMYFPQ
jgi:Outer membrane protein beta-barrel domain